MTYLPLWVVPVRLGNMVLFMRGALGGRIGLVGKTDIWLGFLSGFLGSKRWFDDV